MIVRLYWNNGSRYLKIASNIEKSLLKDKIEYFKKFALDCNVIDLETFISNAIESKVELKPLEYECDDVDLEFEI